MKILQFRNKSFINWVKVKLIIKFYFKRDIKYILIYLVGIFFVRGN